MRPEFIWLDLLSRSPLTSLMKIYAQTMSIGLIKGTVVTYLCVLLPNLSMLSTQDIRVEIAVILRYSACISLSTDLDTLGIH